jgi:hypothetical protein
MTGGGLDSPWRLLNDKGALTSMPSFGGGTPMNLSSLMPQAQQSPGGTPPSVPLAANNERSDSCAAHAAIARGRLEASAALAVPRSLAR